MRRLLRLSIGAFALLGFIHILVTVTPVTCWWARQLAGPWNDPQGEILIVLGAEAPHSTGMIGRSTYWRANYAALVWREGTARQVVFSGGQGVAESMREYAVSHGVPRAAILVESESDSTHTNAVMTAAMLRDQPGRKVLITSDFHMRRAHAAFTRAGLEVLPRPIPDMLKRCSSWPDRWPVMMELGLESVKLGWYGWKGWT